MNRRWFMQRCGAFGWAVSAGGARALWGQEVPPSQRMDAKTLSAIQRGLAFLASQQNDDGSFSGSVLSRNVGVCGLSAMAMMSAGNMPGRGKYGAALLRCVEYVLQSQQANGLFMVPGAVSHGPMYGHGFATLFLAEAYGMAPQRNLRDKLAAAVTLIIQSQNKEGGWRYQPNSEDADLSVTICQVMALRAAKNAGLYVPVETIDRCTEYVKRCQNPDGGFVYMLSQPDASRFPRSAAGIVALYSAGIYKGPEIEKGLDYLEQRLPEGDLVRDDGHFFYGQYYAVQAMWHAGGARWRKWYPAIQQQLLTRQRDDGAWFDSVGAVYGTAMACLILQMPDSYLPIFQK